jgi:hypothetical protein
LAPAELLAGMTEKEIEWKNINNALTTTTVNLAVAKRIVESQGGAFQIAVDESNRVQIQFSLPSA